MEQNKFISDLICIGFFKLLNMKNIKIILILTIGLTIISCESNTYEEISGVVANPTYTKNIQPIINSNCVSCHSAGGNYPELTDYAKVKDQCINGLVLCRIDGTSCGAIMPQGGKMPQVTVDLIKKWSVQGYTN